MIKGTNGYAVEIVREAAHVLAGTTEDYEPLLRLIGERRFVLLGEASHGTHEFYQARIDITKRLIEERGFNTVAVEADFPHAHRVNRFVRGTSDDVTATEALGDFKHFPVWMWRNRPVRDFVRWLRDYNDGVDESAKIGFYGIDLYSLRASIDAVLAYLDRVDPDAARRARDRYSCFDHYEDNQEYGYAASTGNIEPCESEVVDQLLEMQRRATEYANRDGGDNGEQASRLRAADEYFYAEQNARLVQNAEEYYRSMFRPRVSSWNLRDRHMTDTLEALVRYGDYLERPAKVVVWAHNSHLGDARATGVGERGEWNVGQLVRERFGDEALLVGFSTHTGTVTAASDWGESAELKRVRSSLANSYERLFHDTGIKNFLLTMRDREDVREILRESRLERAIGVIYRPKTERASHYFYAHLADQFDAVIYFDETRAVEPLERTKNWTSTKMNAEEDAPDTFPSGM